MYVELLLSCKTFWDFAELWRKMKKLELLFVEKE